MPLKCDSQNSSVRAPVLPVASWRYLKHCAIFFAAGLALVQSGALAGEGFAEKLGGYREVSAGAAGRPQKLEVAQAEDDGAMPPGGAQRFGRRRWQQFQGGPDEPPPGQVRELDTGVPGGLPQPGGPGMFYGRRGPGRFGPGRPGGFRRQGGGPAGGKMFGGPLDLTLLGLSEEQKDRIRQIRLQSAPKARGLRRELKLRRAEMKDLMFDPDATDAQIRGKRRVIRQMQDQLEDVVVDDFLSLRGVLTPEQRKRLPEVRPDARIPVMGPSPASMSGPDGNLRSSGLPPGAGRGIPGPSDGPLD